MAEPISILIALGGGLASFISPCNVVLLPTFISYIGASAKTTRKAIVMSLLYALGFSFTFAVVGIIFTAIPSLIQSRVILNYVSGALMILIAVYLLIGKQINPKPLKMFSRFSENTENHQNLESSEHISHESTEKKEDAPPLPPKKNEIASSFLLGLSLGSSYIPCVTPVFLSILAFASSQGSYTSGIVLMLFYGIGISIPFVIIGSLVGIFNSRVIVKMVKIGSKIQKIFAIFLIWIGIEIIFTGLGYQLIFAFI